MKLILIRHGETDYTIERRYCGGAIDAPLNNKGIRQARRLRRLLSKHKVDVIYASPMIRALQTADIALGQRRIKLIKDSLLRESHLGKWEGHTLDEIKKKFPKDVQKWYQDPLNFGATDGETPVILHKRVTRFLRKLYKSNHKNRTAAIVTHSGPFRIIVGEMNGHGLSDFWKLEPKTCEYKILKTSITKH
jgi:broad specificity phosphatase PhoE